jgi:hypothetical protein
MKVIQNNGVINETFEEEGLKLTSDDEPQYGGGCVTS